MIHEKNLLVCRLSTGDNAIAIFAKTEDYLGPSASSYP
jgi:hypothetical protein